MTVFDLFHAEGTLPEKSIVLRRRDISKLVVDTSIFHTTFEMPSKPAADMFAFDRTTFLMESVSVSFLRNHSRVSSSIASSRARKGEVRS